MLDFQKQYKQLNAMQKLAVDTIDGPLLVIAGPGTGKTQLLSARVAQILQQTDTLPQNILCLTFTENGAINMRERLTRFIGKDAYNVTISTYHAFGGDLITRYPEYFAETRLENPIDELGKHQTLSTIVDEMSYLNPLKQTRHHIGDLISTLSEIKRALLTSSDLRQIAKENTKFIQAGDVTIREIFSDFKTMPRKIEKAMEYFEQTLESIEGLAVGVKPHGHFLPLAKIAAKSLTDALEETKSINKTAPLTKWKNKWLVKDIDNNFQLAGRLENKRIQALADVFDQYQRYLESQGLYDFDDMIIRSIQSLQNIKDLKYTLQEQYLYVLLDEFQDTNAAQLKLVELLSDNPVHEGRPNIMAVGDDDQAIYAFQGAQYSNMLDFYHMYRDVQVINLSENYRSHADILFTAQNISEQIDERLHDQFENISKTLLAASTNLPTNPQISRNEFLGDIAQYNWIAKRIKKLINEGVEPKEIAILAPKHRNLEPIVPYLNALDVPVRYEKRENVLESPVVKQLLAMSKLVLALRDNNQKLANALWVEVLSFDFWKIPIEKIWQMSWSINYSGVKTNSWGVVATEDKSTRNAALILLTLASKVELESLETMLDFMIGNTGIDTHDDATPVIYSPLRSYYTSPAMQTDKPQLFYETLSHLKVLRSKLRDHQRSYDKALTLSSLIDFANMYEVAGQQMINTSPYNQDQNAVQIMTVFKAKGMEYEHVFLPDMIDSTWGSSSRGNANKLTLPPNLAPIRHAGATDDERLRLLFVAITRAKFGLEMTSFRQDYNGNTTKRLKYLDEQEQSDGTLRCMILPPTYSRIEIENNSAPSLEHLELGWQSRHSEGLANITLRSLLEDRLKSYRLSPTHLNTFTDVEHGGPDKFFFKNILSFPEAPSLAMQYGNAMHETMEWVQHTVDSTGRLPVKSAIIKQFSYNIKNANMPESQANLEIERGEKALLTYLDQRAGIFKPGDIAEYNFRNEGVFIGDAHMTGKIDRMEIDKTKKEIIVVDYKTGKPNSSWKREARLHKYKQQLYCYKLLIEESHTFAGYTVVEGRLEFLEPDANGQIHNLQLRFNDIEMQRVKGLIQIVWSKIMNLDFPETEDYHHNLKGILEFEDYLLRVI